MILQIERVGVCPVEVQRKVAMYRGAVGAQTDLHLPEFEHSELAYTGVSYESTIFFHDPKFRTPANGGLDRQNHPLSLDKPCPVNRRFTLPAERGHFATATKLYLEDVMGLSQSNANDLSFWRPGFLPPEFEVLDKQPGSSIVEPDVIPMAPTVLGWNTWDDFSDDCGISRLWAGVHFFDSIPAGQAIGDLIGAGAYIWLKAHIDGNQ